TWYPRDPKGIAWRARPVNLLLGVVLGILLWIAARRLYSVGAANLALLLFAFSAGAIAHFSLATTDGVGALMIFAAAIQLVTWRRNPSRTRTIVLGLVLGGMLAAKFYTFPIFALALILVVLLPPERPWRKAVVMAAVAFLVIWTAYRFHVSWLTLQGGQLFVESPGSPNYQLATLGTLHSFALPIPAGEYLTG